MIQEEKESAELRAEEIENRVTSGSMDGLNMRPLRSRSSIPTSLTALSLASSSPPVSGRSTPKLSSRSAAHELGIMTLILRSGSRIFWDWGSWERRLSETGDSRRSMSFWKTLGGRACLSPSGTGPQWCPGSR
ncbi:UNVERIFIED_CONTAM: hypothetical protein FKN15_046205 [Acipenser sinensis]